MDRRVLLFPVLLALVVPTLVAVGPAAGPAPVLLPSGPSLGPRSHIDTPTADLYVAETLTSARWSTGAIRQHYLGRPFWVEPLTGSGVRVAVIDTGVDPDHPDLQGKIVAWRDFLHGRATPYDDDTHGTHVAGIIAAGGHVQPRPDRHYFPWGAHGVAPGVSLIVAKAMDGRGDGDAATVAEAIRWALDPDGDGDPRDGAHVINLSIGLETAPRRDGTRLPAPVTVPVFGTEGTPEADLVRDAIRQAVRAGAVVVVAAGNHEPGADDATVSFPGTMSEVITVGALDADGRIAAFSNHGPEGSGKPDLVAPGVLLSTFPVARDLEDSRQDGYIALGGTSMAAPMVSGTVALMLEGDPALARLSFVEDRTWQSRMVKNALVSTAEGSTWDPQYGYGRLRVDAAVAAVDQGDGGPHWKAIGLLTLVLVGILGAVLLRRRARRQRAAVWRARAEARARLAAEPAAHLEDEAPPVPHEGDDAQDPSRAGPDETGAEAGAPPSWQRPPWETATRRDE